MVVSNQFLYIVVNVAYCFAAALHHILYNALARCKNVVYKYASFNRTNKEKLPLI